LRLVDKVTKGHATIEEILESEERFDNRFLRSDVWLAARQGKRNGTLAPH
jgi:hypothetical protein